MGVTLLSQRDEPGLLEYYSAAKTFVEANLEMSKSITWQRERDFEKITADDFFGQYCWVVLCSGMKMQVARKMEERLFANGSFNPETIGHPLKRRALKEAHEMYKIWWRKLTEQDFDNKQRLEFLDNLPHIGPITKYHLAKNLGIDVCKPDRHLQRVASRFGFNDAQAACEFIASTVHDKVSVVDLTIWHWCNAHGSITQLGLPHQP